MAHTKFRKQILTTKDFHWYLNYNKITVLNAPKYPLLNRKEFLTTPKYWYFD